MQKDFNVTFAPYTAQSGIGYNIASRVEEHLSEHTVNDRQDRLLHVQRRKASPSSSRTGLTRSTPDEKAPRQP